MEKRMSSPDLQKELEMKNVDGDWIDVSDVTSSNSYTDPTVTIAGGEAPILDNLWACALCQMSFSGVERYEQHMIRDKHNKKLRKELMKKKYGPKYLEMLKNRESGSDIHVEATGSGNESDDDVVVKYCDICKKICTGEVTYQLHMKGKKHQRKVHKLNLLKKLEGNPDIDLGEKRKETEYSDVMAQVKPFAQCAVCKKKFSGPEGFQDHLCSSSHKKKLAIEELSRKIAGEEHCCDLVEGKSEAQNVEIFEGGDFFTSCNACEKKFSGPVPYQQHLISDAHKKKLKKLELTKKMNSLSVKGDETDTFECKECSRSFSIPEEFDKHLKSSVHAKKRNKQQLVQKLKSEYPEMEVQSLTASEMDNIENDVCMFNNSFILICSICHKSFSGPETAKAHFISPKHSKARKQHLILVQRRKMENKKEIF